MSENFVTKVITLAESQVGYKESGNNVTKYASDFDNKYPDFYNTKKQGVAWCDMFFDWLLVTAFGEAEALKLTCQPKKSAGAGCRFSYGYYKKKNQVGSEPKIGAQIFFSKKGTEEDINHTGIVVDVDNRYVYTIEGNSNNQVSRCKYMKTNKTIFGYGYPKYDVAELPLQMPSEPSLRPAEDVARDVISGKYGNGTARIEKLTKEGYDAEYIQSIVNAMLNEQRQKKYEESKKKFNACVSTNGDSLNVRSVPRGTIIGTLQNGTEINVLSVDGDWCKIAEGYVFKQYVKFY